MRKLTLSLTLILAVLFIAGCQGSDNGQDLTMTSEQILISSQVQDPTTTHSIWQKPSPYPTSMAHSTPSPSPTPTQVPTPTPFPTPTQLPTPTVTAEPTASPTPELQNVVADSNSINQDFYWVSLDDDLKQHITGFSYPSDDSGSVIKYDDLRYIRLLHHDFEGNVKQGELIVNASLADEVMEIFYQLYLANYPMTSVLLVDEYGGSANDTISMEANNTSAFNYRFVEGTQRLSRHGYGAAIDINPMLNPYVVGDYISPTNGIPYADRSQDFHGKIDHNDLCYQLFTERGWSWGGDWNYEKDYQHFSKNIA